MSVQTNFCEFRREVFFSPQSWWFGVSYISGGKHLGNILYLELLRHANI